MEGCFDIWESAACGVTDVHALLKFPLLRSWVIAKYGNVQFQNLKMLLVDDGDKLHYEVVTFIPAIARIVEEFLLKVARTEGVTKLEIGITDDMVSVWHNGNCIPVETDDKVLKNNPRAVFEGSVQDWEDQFRTCNLDSGLSFMEPTVEQILLMLSKLLKIHIKDANLKNEYEGEWSSKAWKEKCKAFRGKKTISKVDFQLPSYAHVEEFQSIMKTRAIQIQATIGNKLDIQFNGKALNVNNFEQYVTMYPKKTLESRPEALPRVCHKLSENIELCITRSDGIFEQESYVNGTHTVSGGTHIELIVQKIESNARIMGIDFKKDEIRNSLLIFMNFSLDNPQFTLSNDCLTTNLDESLLSDLDDVYLHNCIRNITEISRKRNVATTQYLEDAEKAGGEESMKCTLILCQGVSAANFVRSGISYLGRGYHGILALKGKLPNALGSLDEISNHVDLKRIIEAIGLDTGVHYNSASFLRYGHLMLMADQDVDGSHIKGLLINFLAQHWPSLLKIDGFLSQFITPVVKAKVDGKPRNFYSTLEFQIWWQSNVGKHDIRGVRFFKGLATHVDEDCKEYFTNIDKHNIIFKSCGEMDGNAIELGFSPERTNERKAWIKKTMSLISRKPERVVLDMMDAEYISYHDFVHKELVHYSVSNVLRSIPSFVDGLKPSQRKVLCAALGGGLKSDMEDMVYQFSGYVCKKMAYHHGGTNMETTIIGMAQNFVGKNNINLLEPKGQFGSRIEGTEGSASARYLRIQLGRLTSLIFRKEDENFLSYMPEDGIKIEPRWYLPVIPMCIVNGCGGIATGWSTNVPMFDPRVIIQNLLILLSNEKATGQLTSGRPVLIPMRPHYLGFKGNVENSEEPGVFIISGLVDEINDTEIEITDIPPTQTINEYKKFLSLLKRKAIVESFQELHKERDINFKVKFFSAEKLKEAKEKGGLLRFLKLVSNISTRNMYLIDHMGVVGKFDSAEEIICRFFDMRLPFYNDRKALLLEEFKIRLAIQVNRIRFVQEARNREINLMEDNIVENLTETGYELIKGDPDFGHLLGMQLCGIRDIDIEELKRFKDSIGSSLAMLEKLTGVDLWINDLEVLLNALDKVKGTAPAGVQSSRKRNRPPEVVATCASSPGLKKKIMVRKVSKTADVGATWGKFQCRAGEE